MLRNNAISDVDLGDMWVLHTGTFGVNYERDNFLPKLRKWRPDYVIWRLNGLTVPRGWGKWLALHAKTVFLDSATWIWQIEPFEF